MELLYCLDQLNEARVIREESRSQTQLNTRFGALPLVMFTEELSGRFESMEVAQFKALRCGRIGEDLLAQLRDGEVRIHLASAGTAARR